MAIQQIEPGDQDIVSIKSESAQENGEENFSDTEVDIPAIPNEEPINSRNPGAYIDEHFDGLTFKSADSNPDDINIEDFQMNNFMTNYKKIYL